MNSTKRTNKPKKTSAVLVIALVIGAGVLLAAGGFGFAAFQESHDSFCASCHTQPETTFVQRSTTAPAVDLASFHQPKQTLCIDCHSGQGLVGRMGAEMMGARNALKWFTGTATQPAVHSVPIRDENCLKCHQAVTKLGYTAKQNIPVPSQGRGGFRGGEREGHINHWHEEMARWQAASATAGSCVSCHAGHKTNSPAASGFLTTTTVNAVCDACHQVLRREGGRD